MSKETPEVGDVWEYKGCLIHITRVCGNCIEFLFQEKDGLRKRFVYDFNCTTKEYFIKNHTYIGKAKGSIKDLFEVEDENS